MSKADTRTAACALHVKDQEQVFIGLRFLTGAYIFHEEPQRLWQSMSNHLGFYGMGEGGTSEHRRHLHRRNQTMDKIAHGDLHFYSSTSKAWVTSRPSASVGFMQDDADVDSDEDEELQDLMQRASLHPGREGPLPDVKEMLRCGGYPMKEAAAGLAHEAGAMLGTDQYQGALGAALRAMTRVEGDPLLMMIAAIASISRAGNRLADNRHYMIIQVSDLSDGW